MVESAGNLPGWIARRGRMSGASPVKALLRSHGLNTVCESARCPNQPECFGRKVATFMILGDSCTRGCRFCAVVRDTPLPVDPDEPRRVAAAAAAMGLEYAVVTSVTRDDLPDGGASQFARTIEAFSAELPGVPVEVLIPDLQGDGAALDVVLEAGPAVLNHNVETVPRLYPEVRAGADYGRSLEVIRRAVGRDLPVKSGLMLGLGERDEEVIEVMEDLYGAGCLLLTIGQYLQPSRECLPVDRFVTPDRFDFFGRLGYKIGFRYVASGPLIRSSYQALEGYRKISA
jgi:lipoic acid synthetase